MEITDVEIHELTYTLQDIESKGGHHRYAPGETAHPPGFVLTIRTDTGLEGNYRGFMYTPPMVAQIRMAAPEFLIGRDPLEREEIWQDIWRGFRHTDHSGLGPIDIALWDLAGIYYGESISTLLGGFRDSVPAYASTIWADDRADGLGSPDQYASFAETKLANGYQGFKLHPSGDPDYDIELCHAVAEAVGDEMDLMLDPASEYRTYTDALRVGRVLDELGFYWYEDPVSDTGESINGSKRLTQELETPILAGEHQRTGPFGRADFSAAEALDLVRADAHLDGGITGVMKIAHVVEAFGLDVELHVGSPSHLHCMSAIRNTNYYECGLSHPQVDWIDDQGYRKSFENVAADGTIDIPDGPGLGVEIDWEFVDANRTNHIRIDQQGSSGLS